MTDLVELADVARELRWADEQLSKYGAQLQLYVSAATPIIESLAGPIVPRTIHELADGGGRAIPLPHRPNVVTGVTVDGTPWTGWIADLEAALVHAGLGRRYSPGLLNVDVTYDVGFDPVPENVQLAAIALVVHNWRRANPQVQPAEESMAVPAGFAVPNAVVQLLAPQRPLPGFA